MNESKPNVPKLRFPGFTDPWEQRKLGEVVGATYGGGTPKTSVKDYWDGPIPWIQSSNVQDDSLFEAEIPKGITELGLRKSAAQLVPANSIAVVTHVGVGKLIYLPFCYTTSQDFISLSDLKAESVYLTYALYRRLQCEIHIVQGSAIKGITKEELLNKEISLPSFPEQQAIGVFFSDLDDLITLHQRKLDHLKLQKRGLLQKMFPKDGSDVPEIRFPGFTDPWEQRKLGEVGSTFTGLTGKTREDFGHGDAKFIPYTNVFANPITDPNQLDAIEIDTKQNEVTYGDAFFTTSSETPREVGMSSVWLSHQRNVYLNSFCFGYRQNGSFDPYYLAYMLRAEVVRSKLVLLAQGISRYNISKHSVMEISVPYPTLREQQAIGAFFSDLDDLITLHQRKLDHLKLQKKALLQQMFV